MALVATVALLGAACSSDDSSDTTAAATATEASEASGDSAVESAIVKEVQTALAALEYLHRADRRYLRSGHNLCD